MLKKIVRILILLLVIVCIYSIESNAAIVASSKTVNSGENVTVSVTSNVPLTSYSVSVTNLGGLTFVNSSGGTGAGGQKITGAGTPTEPITNLASFTFKVPTVTKDTTYTVSFSGTIMEGVDFSAIADNTTTATITVKAPATPTPPPATTAPEATPTVTATPAPAVKSSNANLKNLGITPNDFSGFTASKTEYYVTVPYEVETVRVYAKKAESSQTISGEGDKSLEVGATTRCPVTVTAEDGTQKTYNIYVTRKSEPTETVPNVVEEPEELLKLSTLEVKNAVLSPEFNPDIYEYGVSLTDNNIEKLDILATANIENASIEVTGNENFMEGDNTVTIVLKTEDGTKAATYTITVTKGVAAITETPEPIVEEEETPVKEEKKNIFAFLKSGNTGMIVILVIAIIVLIASIVTVVVILVKNKKEANGEMMNFTPNSEYNVFEEKEEKKEEAEPEEKTEKRRGKHF